MLARCQRAHGARLGRRRSQKHRWWPSAGVSGGGRDLTLRADDLGITSLGQPNPKHHHPTRTTQLNQPNPTRNNPTQSTILLLGPRPVSLRRTRRRRTAASTSAGGRRRPGASLSRTQLAHAWSEQKPESCRLRSRGAGGILVAGRRAGEGRSFREAAGPHAYTRLGRQVGR